MSFHLGGSLKSLLSVIGDHWTIKYFQHNHTNTETAVSEVQHGLWATTVTIFSYSWGVGYEIKLRQLNSFYKCPTGCSRGLSSYSGSEVFSRGMLLMELQSCVLAIFTWNLAFSAGSSKHGNALRAWVASNCVTAIHLKRVTYRYQRFQCTNTESNTILIGS